jgi:hypothetical protein
LNSENVAEPKEGWIAAKMAMKKTMIRLGFIVAFAKSRPLVPHTIVNATGSGRI